MAAEDVILSWFSQLQFTPIIFFLFGYMLVELFHKEKKPISDKILLSILISVGISGILIFIFNNFGSDILCGGSTCRIIDSMYHVSIFEWIIISTGSAYLLLTWIRKKKQTSHEI